MEDWSQHRVYFELPALSAELKKRLENYFRVRRKSGGGECGLVTSVTGSVHSVAFKLKQDQERVLQRAQHVLEYPGGSLTLTLLQQPPSGTSPTIDVTDQNRQLTNASVSPPGVEEYELEQDGWLLLYLKETPKAETKLKEKLAAVNCSALRYLSETRVSVQHPGQAGSPGNDQSWKRKVEEIWKEYTTHYVVEPQFVRALLKSSSDAAGEVKLYNEVGLVVVVGERSQVELRLAELGAQANEEEKTTKVRVLGEPKLRLLWGEIEQSVAENVPGVQISRKDAKQLILEGSREMIIKAGKLISELENSVKIRAMSGKSPHFLAFLMNAYGGPGELKDHLKLGEMVELELSIAGLQFYAFFDGALDDAEGKFEKNFKELKFNLPKFSVMLLSELCAKLKSKSADINKSKSRVDFHVTTEGSLWLLGHTEEVDDLTEDVNLFILDQARIQQNITLPFSSLTHQLQTLLELHKFDCSGVQWTQMSSSPPTMALEGPSCRVMDVRTRLTSFLSSVVQTNLVIDLPGAVRYFQSDPGTVNMSTIARSHKCLLKLEAQPQMNLQDLSIAKYSLRDGLQILVFQGDITKQRADALVNCANEQLDHCSGVAAALSRAGGPQVQQESNSIIKLSGNIPTGNVVATTGGNLDCKKLLHAVGPVAGQHGGQEKELLEKAVRGALDLAKVHGFQSIAIPCISSGMFAVPIPICTETIVSAVKKFGDQEVQNLRRITLIDQREEVVRAFMAACDRLLPGTRNFNLTDKDFKAFEASQDKRQGTGGASGGASSVNVEIVYGTIENQQVDVLVSPMVGQKPESTRIGYELGQRVGTLFSAAFKLSVKGATPPGDIVVLKNLPCLACKAVVLLNMISWDNKSPGKPVQVLRGGIQKILSFCETKGYTTVALPMLGTGSVLRFPESVVTTVLLEEISAFEQKHARASHLLCRIVLHPSNHGAKKALEDHMPNKVSGPDTKEELSMMVGSVKVALRHGNIVEAGTDAIVNSTDFSDHHYGVSKAILAAAGPSVWQQVSQARRPNDAVYFSGPGRLACKEIVHACFQSKVQTIRKTCEDILQLCDKKGFKSVAFPAVNTGKGGMESSKVCTAMMDGIRAALKVQPKSLSLICIVMLDPQVFQTFRSALKGPILLSESSEVNMKGKAQQKLQKVPRRSSSLSSLALENLSSICFKPQPTRFSVTCCGSAVLQNIQKDLLEVLQKQLIEREVSVQSFSKMDGTKTTAVLSNVKLLGISLELARRQSPGADAAASADAKEEDVYVLRGLKEDVLSVVDLINQAVQKALAEELLQKDEATLALTIQWSLKDSTGSWLELSLSDNYRVEEAFQDNQVHVDVLDLAGMNIKVDLKTQRGTDLQNDKKFEMKRVKSDTMLELPAQWEPMEGKVFKKVELQPDSVEYRRVAQGFHQMAQFTIVKIERIQNLFLWHAFSICRQRILTKNGAAHLGERLLYHGTTSDSGKCIEQDRFDRSFAGKTGVMYGQGVYFAVDAEYSASRFSPPDSAGLKRVYMARVLTGHYTKGNPSMKAPPKRPSSSTDCYDSLVDNTTTPTMFVIFHDDQAYPEYQITFK